MRTLQRVTVEMVAQTRAFAATELGKNRITKDQFDRLYNDTQQLLQSIFKWLPPADDVEIAPDGTPKAIRIPKRRRKTDALISDDIAS